VKTNFSPWIQLFRVFAPSWRFFDRPVQVPILWVRYIDQAEKPGPWEKRLLRKAASSNRSWKQIFLNSTENHLLICRELLNQHEFDLQHGVVNSVSSQLIERLVLLDIPGDSQSEDRSGSKKLQYKMTFSDHDDYLSPILDLPAKRISD
jgi:hypothetical protein